MKTYTPLNQPPITLRELHPFAKILPGDWINHKDNPWNLGYGFLPLESDSTALYQVQRKTIHYSNNLRFFRPISS